MHEVEVSLRVKIGIPKDKKVTVANIATAIKDLGIEPRIAEQMCGFGVGIFPKL